MHILTGFLFVLLGMVIMLAIILFAGGRQIAAEKKAAAAQAPAAAVVAVAEPDQPAAPSPGTIEVAAALQGGLKSATLERFITRADGSVEHLPTLTTDADGTTT